MVALNEKSLLVGMLYDQGYELVVVRTPIMNGGSFFSLSFSKQAFRSFTVILEKWDEREREP